VRAGRNGGTGYSRWFERLLAELGFEVWIGDPAEIKTKRVKNVALCHFLAPDISPEIEEIVNVHVGDHR
jgi:hypothetical protein